MAGERFDAANGSYGVVTGSLDEPLTNTGWTACGMGCEIYSASNVLLDTLTLSHVLCDGGFCNPMSVRANPLVSGPEGLRLILRVDRKIH